MLRQMTTSVNPTYEVIKEDNTFTTSNTTWSTSTDSSSGNITISATDFQPVQTGQQCNESKVHDHSQKAVFHGMKSAFRFISLGDKGVDVPQPDNAARIAGEVGSAYLKEKDIEYDRERSLDDLQEQHMSDDGVMDKLKDLFKGALPDGGRGPLKVSELEEAIERAWNKIDSGSHKGGARVAVAAAEAYLGEEIHDA